MKKILSLILALVMLFSFFSCDEEIFFRYDMKKSPKNLDPQMAYDLPSQIILKHVMQGLVKENESGNIVCDGALDYKISNNGKTYTFTLQKTLKWSNGTQVIADDFVFALKRIFLKETLTPNQSSFLCIKNAQAIINNEKSIDSLGVKAVSDTILEITLENENPRFLYALATTAAYPCNEDFFNLTKGKYGYDERHLLFNGAYVISKRTDNYVQLYPNNDSIEYSERQSTSIVLYTNSTYDAQSRFLNGTTDFAQISQSVANQIDTEKFECYGFESSTWVLGFNQNNDILKNKALRQALFSSICDIVPNTNGADHYKQATGIIVPSIEIDGKAYRSLAGELNIEPKNDPSDLLKSALKELERNNIKNLTLLCPNDPVFKYYVTYIQKAWNDKLGIIINFISPDEDEYYKTLYSGDFDLAIFPISATENSVLSQLDKLSNQNNYNYLYYNSDDYETKLNDIAKSSNVEEIVRRTFWAEKHLIEDAILLPLVYEKSYVAINKANVGISFSPFGPSVDFTKANKK